MRQKFTPPWKILVVEFFTKESSFCSRHDFACKLLRCYCKSHTCIQTSYFLVVAAYCLSKFGRKIYQLHKSRKINHDDKLIFIDHLIESTVQCLRRASVSLFIGIFELFKIWNNF